MKARLVALLVVTVMMISAMGVSAQDATIVDLAAGNEDLSTLVSLVEAAGLVDALADPDASLTVFAPTNEAFAALPDFVVDYLANNPDVLTRVLTYHVVPAEVMAADVAAGAAPTLEGSELTLATEGGVTVNGVEVVAADVDASNGVVHVINGVLVPPMELPEVDPLAIEGAIVAAGSSTVGPLTIQISSQWADAGAPEESVPSVDIIGSGAGFERFCVAGDTDISNASRAIRDSEIESCASIDRTPIPFLVGIDALTVAVSTDNDFVEDVTMEELAALFGATETWADVRADMPAEAIQRYIPGSDSGTYDFFVEVVLDEDATLLGAAEESENDNVLVQGIQGSPYATGFFGYAYYQANADTLTPLSIDGVAPTAETAESGEYPLSRPLFIYSDPQIMKDKPQVAAYINFYLTNVTDALNSNLEQTVAGAEADGPVYFPVSANSINTSKLYWLAAVAE